MGSMSDDALRNLEVRKEELECQKKELGLKIYREDTVINHNLLKQEAYRRAIEVCVNAVNRSNVGCGPELKAVVKASAIRLKEVIEVM